MLFVWLVVGCLSLIALAGWMQSGQKPIYRRDLPGILQHGRDNRQTSDSFRLATSRGDVVPPWLEVSYLDDPEGVSFVVVLPRSGGADPDMFRAAFETLAARSRRLESTVMPPGGDLIEITQFDLGADVDTVAAAVSAVFWEAWGLSDDAGLFITHSWAQS